MTDLAALPDIPRVLTATAEWAACLLYILMLGRRRSTAVLVALAGVALVLLLGVHLLAEMLPLAFWTPGMLVAAGVMYAFLALAARTSPIVTGYLLARAFVLAELVASLHWQLHVFFFPTPAAEVGQALVTVAVYAACFATVLLIERRLFLRGRAPEVEVRALAAAAAVAVVTFMMSNLSFISTNTPFSGPEGLSVFYIRTLVDLAGYVALLALHAQRQHLHQLREVDAMAQLVRSQHQQYLQSKRNIDEVNRKYHDLKHYITAFRAESDPTSQAGYLDKLEQSLSGYAQQIETGNGILDAVLTAKLAEAEERQVPVTVVADGRLLEPIEPLDISALFGNALDNALHASAAVPDPKRRFIRVGVQARRGFVVAEVENSFHGVLEFDDGLPVSTKGDSAHHGYGLRNMRQIAEHYGGTLSLRAESGVFTVAVVLPVVSA
ncbi:ATP-binding protein [Nesterenkonia rhizosphaerae]|uniref:Sensor histidine kinase n=1 Tax=Nesterenkonia rhizosphaerae TaxID=1348272 RepID=A0ABP9G0B3_9MICC